MHGDNLDTRTVGRHRFTDNATDTAMTDWPELVAQTRPGVELHADLSYGRRNKRRHCLKIECGSSLFATTPDGIQSFGSGMEVGEDLHRVVEMHRDAKRPDGQCVADDGGLSDWQLEGHPHQQRVARHLVVL